jgi:hypothetical protein
MIFEQEATLSGYVTDSFMEPLDGALVRVSFHSTYEENYSDSTGYFKVDNIPLCYCMKNATCSLQGYQSQWVLLSISENTTYDFILTALNQTCYPVFNGTTGQNGWYISCVNVSLVINGDVDEVFYMVDSGSWTQYTSTFELCQSGLHTLYWYWTFQGEESETLSIALLIDRDIPQLQLSQDRIAINKILISVEASDGTSGIDRVEFAVDGDLRYVVYTEPYDYVLVGFGTHQIKTTAFDTAGNSVNNTIATSLKTQNLFQSFRSSLLQLLFRIYTYDILNN